MALPSCPKCGSSDTRTLAAAYSAGTNAPQNRGGVRWYGYCRAGILLATQIGTFVTADAID
jgi:hypothetical protein